jgi:glycosyltransferase involved in cell wall biosynthesis
MIAFHFPPLAGSSGIQRTLRFAQQLPRFGWEPLVLSAAPLAYERVDEDLIAEVPADTVVRRAFALDSARHLALGGRYLARLARPDRWISWKFDGIRQGMQLIRRYRPQLIWSTYPIATAHVIAAELQRRSGLPWVADFRDPMAQDGYPADARTWQRFHEIEQTAVSRAALSMFTTPGAVQCYRDRYPAFRDRMMLLENGFDEESFVRAERDPAIAQPLCAGSLTLLHSGIVYPDERDPSHLFEALARMRRAGRLPCGRLRIRFRAAVHEQLLQSLAARYGVQDVIETLPAIGYAPALTEMLRADGLLLLQAANCNEQIPAKVYEYLRAGVPILCLADSRGDTQDVMRRAGLDTCAGIDKPGEIAELLERFIADPRALPRARDAHGASRLARTATLAAQLDRLRGAGAVASFAPLGATQRGRL